MHSFISAKMTKCKHHILSSKQLFKVLPTTILIKNSSERYPQYTSLCCNHNTVEIRVPFAGHSGFSRMQYTRALDLLAPRDSHRKLHSGLNENINHLTQRDVSFSCYRVVCRNVLSLFNYKSKFKLRSIKI